ncbi:sperm acrosome membrane-associated protein 4-like [Heptranchias perlo]|uniref:sperm acrosome membrane-associated protein 4-like n=1 Tax=Heptranchias perlo TaxID=212740 RepID=UPI003559BA2A
MTTSSCLKFPRMCRPTETCLTSKAVGKKGKQRIVLYEKGCMVKSLCGICGTKTAMGIVFAYNNSCCNTDLCNGAPGAKGSLAAGVGRVLVSALASALGLSLL